MLLSAQDFDLTFPMVRYGLAETPFDLRILLYEGSAKASLQKVFSQIASGELGGPILERLELLKKIHEAMTARLVGGGSKVTAYSTLLGLRNFFAWAEAGGHPLSIDSIEATYRLWCDHLLHRIRYGEIEEITGYNEGSRVSAILDAALERPQPLILTTRLFQKKRGERAVGVFADKQNLADTFAFGHLCLDVIDSLPTEVVFGPLPVQIKLRDGRVIEKWSKLRNPEKVKCLQPGYKKKHNKVHTLKLRGDWEADRTLYTRYPLANLRIIAELMVFIAQTGMNLAQAHQLRRTQFSYKSTIDGYQISDYKRRRSGEVMFEIFSEYRPHFERYLAWRDAIFADQQTDYLFPFIRRWGAAESTQPAFDCLSYDICKQAGIPFVSPKKLRKTRVNWLLRRSRDPELTAEQVQHSKQILLRVYEKPSLQVAQVEIIEFWKKNDPRLDSSPMPNPALGVCDGNPASIADLPLEAPTADCSNPTGCLFCDHHRDIDSLDYVWSMASMRYLNTIVLSRFLPKNKGKADSARHVELAIGALTSKLEWFKSSNTKRKMWVQEASEKMAEGDYHIHWRYLIESAEGI